MAEAAWPGSWSFEQEELFIMAAVGEVGGWGKLGVLGPAGSPDSSLPARSKPLAPWPTEPLHPLPDTQPHPVSCGFPSPTGRRLLPELYPRSSLYLEGPPVIAHSPLPHQYLFICKGSGPPSPPPRSLP